MSKRTRHQVEDDYSDEEHNVLDAETTYRAVNLLLDDLFADRVTKGDALREILGSAYRKSLIPGGRVYTFLQSKMAYVPRKIPDLVAKKSTRNEYTLVVDHSLGGTLNKYAYKGSTLQNGLAKFVVIFVIANKNSVTGETLIHNLEYTKLIDDTAEGKAEGASLFDRMISMRLLDKREAIVLGGQQQPRTYAVGPAASLFYKVDELVAQIEDIMGYSEQNQPKEIADKNHEHIKELVEEALT